jgi:hypothetical protein
VSREAATPGNPPMLMRCGHVVNKSTLQRLSGGGAFKCPYCPLQQVASDAMALKL